MIGFGALFIKRPPTDINGAFGYRTKRFTKNKDTWLFAHNYIGRIWLISGLILLPISVAVMIVIVGKGNDTLGIAGAIMEMINLELRDPERPDSRGVRVFLGASGRLKAEGDEPVVKLTINDRALELYNT